MKTEINRMLEISEQDEDKKIYSEILRLANHSPFLSKLLTYGECHSMTSYRLMLFIARETTKENMRLFDEMLKIKRSQAAPMEITTEKMDGFIEYLDFFKYHKLPRWKKVLKVIFS